MLTSLAIENFKGVAGRQRIDFAPLTLLFGANSGGKSTILQALLYLQELLERGNADVDRTELGGSVVELGGFARLVHRHELDRAIVLRAEFDLPRGLEEFGRMSPENFFLDLNDAVDSAWIEVTVRWRTTKSFRGPILDRAVIGVGEYREPLIWLETLPELREDDPVQVRINFAHELLKLPQEEVLERWRRIALEEAALGPTEPLRTESADASVMQSVDLWNLSRYGDLNTLPAFWLSSSQFSALPPIHAQLRLVRPDELADTDDIEAFVQLEAFLDLVIPGVTSQLVATLRDACYLGPLRVVPPRGFLYERFGRNASWADGLAAWTALLSDRGDLVERTNVWLRRLGAGCQLVSQQLFDRSAGAEEITASSIDHTVRRLLLDTGSGSLVLPSEVGAGISQVMPVVVAALDGRSRLTIVEQPELHVHPALQVELGDLFIDAVTAGRRRQLLIETHSEHVILRLLRRIRETTEKELAEGAPAFTLAGLSVLYVEATPEGVNVRQLRVDENGEFIDRWPKGFFEERARELF